MPKIKIIGDSLDTAKPKSIPKTEMNSTKDRFRAGGKYELTLDKSFNKQGNKK